MSLPPARLAAACRALAAAGLSPGSSGNASVRTRGGAWVTASGTSFASMSRGGIVRLDATSGRRRPSKEAGLHAAVYAVRPEVGAIVHLHAPAATALACLPATGDPLPPYTPYRIRVLGPVERVPYAAPGSPRLVELVAEAATRSVSLLLAHHGLLVGAADLDGAVAAAAEFETASGLTLALTGSAAELLDPATAWRSDPG